MWHPQVTALADRFAIVTCDLRGFGATPPPTGPFKHCEDLAQLVDRLALRDITVVGHSIGALYAFELALMRPAEVRGVVALCMSGLGVPPYPDDILAMFGELKTLARTVGVEAAKARWARCGWFTSGRAIPEVAARLDRYLADYSGWYWLHDTPATPLAPPVIDRLDELAASVLVIDGALDLPYNQAIAATLIERLPRAERMHLPGAGHMASLEQPAVINDAIARFAARVAGARST